MNRLFINFLGAIVVCSCFAFCNVKPDKNEPFTYNYSVDLTQLKDDQLTVRLDLNRSFESDTVIFSFPKMVPGIYGTLDFGKNITSLNAYDKTNKILQFKRVNVNQWLFTNARSLKYLTYKVDDSWEMYDQMETGRYKSAESSFDKNFFVINNNSLFGYFVKNEKSAFRVTVKRPKQFFGATSLPRQILNDSTDYYETANYAKLVDNPILYSVPDTSDIDLDEVKVRVAVFSNSHEKIANQLAGHIRSLLAKQKNFLGGKLPISDYTFIIYHNVRAEKDQYSGDGLEHSQSTLILLRCPLNIDAIKTNVYGIASHEFFHTVMPLALHSEEIQNYDFSNPEMSEHLWLYEGMTEYFTRLLPIKSNSISLDEFLKRLEDVISKMKKFDNTLPMTTMSKQAINRQDQYMNFYLRGALFNLCLDIKLKELSNGKMGVQELIRKLMEKYNENTPFKDDELFNEIAAITKSESVRDFFKLYVESGNEPPLKEYLQKVGIEYSEKDNSLHLASAPAIRQIELRKQWINN